MITPTIIQSQLKFAENKGWLKYYQESADFYGIPIEILLAKDSRESWLGSFPGLIANGWYGNDGKSRGISQINQEVYPFAKNYGPDDVRAYVAKGAEILRSEIDSFNGNVRHGLAAYNTGRKNVQSALNKGIDPDVYTTKGNYSADVMNRAKLIRSLSADQAIPISVKTAKVDGKIILGVGALIGILSLAKKYGYV